MPETAELAFPVIDRLDSHGGVFTPTLDVTGHAPRRDECVDLTRTSNPASGWITLWRLTGSATDEEIIAPRR
jgi:hypothetical protein